MTHIHKSSPPQSLLNYEAEKPDSTWEEMVDDGFYNGILAANECRNQAIRDQKGLCAYCEQRISSDNPRYRRIEHFHPKSDLSGNHNWGLDWNNMIAVCDGGSAGLTEIQRMYPLPLL